MRDEQTTTATELHGADTREVLAHALAGDLVLQPLEESEDQRKHRVLGPEHGLTCANRAERRCIEAKRIAADLSYSHLKASGRLREEEDHRALAAQVQFGDAR